MRLFVAVWPDAATQHRLSVLDLGSDPRVRPVAPGQWHITLRFCGEVSDNLVPPLCEALSRRVALYSEPVCCTVGPATAWFSGSRVLQVPAAGVDGLADVVRNATVPVVPVPTAKEPPFVGHLTLARMRGGPRQPIRADLEGIPFSATWTVDGIDVVVSHSSPAGVRYTTLARLPLGDRRHDY